MPVCEVCGMESNGAFFCCAHCAEHAGLPQMRDRVDTREIPSRGM